MKITAIVWGLAVSFAASQLALAQTVSRELREFVPQNLLGLVHAPEVHQELGLDAKQVERLEALFTAIDGDWFRARITKQEEQYATIDQLEQRVVTWFAQNTSAKQQDRLNQLELQSLGMRMLLRSDVGDKISLSSSQKSELLELAKSVSTAAAALQKATMKNQVTETLTQAVAAATQAESGALQTLIKPEQLQQLSSLVGKPFDTTQLKRIYPMAPEFVQVDEWINSKPTSLRELRGKVVLVHFYAFQCHNCHANFGHYQKWHEEFSNDEVVVIGIQTPETSLERNPSSVREAAKEKGMAYPIMLDLQSKNWAAWANTMWPTVYVIDKDGYLRHWWQGELNWQGATGDKTIHDLIVSLVKEQDGAAANRTDGQ
jgi:peroxiredoxin